MQPIRRRIVEILKEQGTATVAELAGQLGMAQVSVRHHLEILVGEDLVQNAGVRRHDGAGRPSQIYVLTREAARLFPQRHDALAAGILEEMKSLLPPEEVREAFLRLAARTASQAPAPRAEQPLEQRLDDIIEFLTEKGYDARWVLHDGRYEVQACNCPYSGVADHHPEVCLMDQAMMKHLLPDARRRESHALDGASRCVYRIETQPASQAAKSDESA